MTDRIVEIFEETIGARPKNKDPARTLNANNRPYQAALKRQHRARGLPDDAELNRIQRYEAHLERGLHKALDRLRDFQEARGAVRPRPSTVAVAVLQTGPPVEGQNGFVRQFYLFWTG